MGNIGDGDISLDQVRADYTRYADYAETDDLTRARKFQTAARRLMLAQPQTSVNRSGTIQTDTKSIWKELEIVTAWIASGGGNSTARPEQRPISIRNWR